MSPIHLFFLFGGGGGVGLGLIEWILHENFDLCRLVLHKGWC